MKHTPQETIARLQRVIMQYVQRNRALRIENDAACDLYGMNDRLHERIRSLIDERDFWKSSYLEEQKKFHELLLEATGHIPERWKDEAAKMQAGPDLNEMTRKQLEELAFNPSTPENLAKKAIQKLSNP
jgi:hypothetical protein